MYGFRHRTLIPVAVALRLCFDILPAHRKAPSRVTALLELPFMLLLPVTGYNINVVGI